MDIEHISKEIYRIPIPIPFPMKYVYCYMFRENTGWSIVDTGLNYPPAIEAWREVFNRLKVNPKSIHSIYLTHFHPDHFGLAGWMQDITGAKVFISEKDFHMAKRVWSEHSEQASRVGEMCRINGVPEKLMDEIVENMQKIQKHVWPLPDLTILKEEEITLGKEKWQVLSAPGHSDGLICFYQPEKKWLIAADHILDKITPNISLWPGANPNPLGNYLHSINKMQFMDVCLTLPAHGKLIDDLSGRIQQLNNHHQKRLDDIYVLAKDGKNAYQIALTIFQHKNLTAHQWRFAIAETMAHLEFLVYGNKLVKEKEQGIIIYRAES
jgi:glyoxylase-like metal-dependent hydrolase (beta-lactamase superfamily II)